MKKQSTTYTIMKKLLLSLFISVPFIFPAQNVDVQTVTATFVSYQLYRYYGNCCRMAFSSQLYFCRGTSFTVSGSSITIDISYTSGPIILPAFMPFSHDVDLGMLPAASYSITCYGYLNGILEDTFIYTPMNVTSCCEAIPSFTGQ